MQHTHHAVGILLLLVLSVSVPRGTSKGGVPRQGGASDGHFLFDCHGGDETYGAGSRLTAQWKARSCRPPRKHILGSLFFGGVAQLGLDTCLSAATDKDVRRFDWFCNLLAILSRPAVTLAFLRMGDALTLAQAALSASALVLGVLLAYADVICSKLCRDRRAPAR